MLLKSRTVAFSSRSPGWTPYALSMIIQGQVDAQKDLMARRSANYCNSVSDVEEEERVNPKLISGGLLIFGRPSTRQLAAHKVRLAPVELLARGEGSGKQILFSPSSLHLMHDAKG